MNIKLLQKQIGQRITELRRMKGFSQEDLAKSVNISRPSLAQIELGNRGVNVFELQQVSLVLSFSMDEFMSENFAVSLDVEGIAEAKSEKTDERVSVPTLKVGKFKNVLLHFFY